ncbi:MAG: hypothetical protein ACQGVC_11425 [Myxococcota bacterium]
MNWMVLSLVSASVALGVSDAPGLRALLALAAGGVAALALLQRSLRPLSRPAAGVVIGWVVLAFVQARWAPTPGEGALSAAGLLSALCLFLVAHTAVPRGERERLIVGLGLGGTCVAGVALWFTVPGGAASFPLATPDRLGGFLVLPVILGLAALCFCAPDGRSARWTIAWFAIVTLCAAGLAATRSGVAVFAGAVAAGTLLALSRLPSRRGFAAAAALAGLALVSIAPVVQAPDGAGLARAGFLPADFAAGWNGELQLTRVAVLLLSAAVVLRRIRPLRPLRPLRRGRASLAAWGGVGAVFCVAPLALVDSSLEVPAITSTAAVLAGLAWPAAAAPPGERPAELRLTRGLLAALCLGIAVALAAGGPWVLVAPLG